MKSIRNAALSVALAGAFGVATPAFAGECPADKRVADGQGQKMVTHAARGVTDTVVTSTDLSNERVALKDHQFRARRLVVQSDGIVPWHSHAERPAMIYVVSGEIIEYASNCAVPIVHKAGDVAREAKDTSHWWHNKGKATVELISVDILPPQMKVADRGM